MSDTTVYPASLLDFITDETFDLSFTMGVLIHIAPDDLRRAYRTLYNTSHRYILVAEYYSPKPVEIEYRGHAGRLWKRDFAGEMLDTYPDLRLLDYGFRYHRDPQHPMDDISWFLMEKGQ
jgi:pseudaminic acid biosynthesis-associated methylase